MRQRDTLKYTGLKILDQTEREDGEACQIDLKFIIGIYYLNREASANLTHSTKQKAKEHSLAQSRVLHDWLQVQLLCSIKFNRATSTDFSGQPKASPRYFSLFLQAF